MTSNMDMHDDPCCSDISLYMQLLNAHATRAKYMLENSLDPVGRDLSRPWGRLRLVVAGSVRAVNLPRAVNREQLISG